MLGCPFDLGAEISQILPFRSNFSKYADCMDSSWARRLNGANCSGLYVDGRRVRTLNINANATSCAEPAVAQKVRY